ncbi:FAM192A/Fyv6 N-terminal domain-containing protein [Plasmodiophora brassicae]
MSDRFTESAVLSSSDGVSLNVSKRVDAPVGAPRRRIRDESGPSLYETLQATKQEKEAEFEMQITRMSAPPGLDEEEAEFLNDAVEQAARAEHIRRLQESKELAAYSSAVSEIVRSAPEPAHLTFTDAGLTAPDVAVPDDPPVVVVSRRPKRRPPSKSQPAPGPKRLARATKPSSPGRPAAPILAAQYASSSDDDDDQ